MGHGLSIPQEKKPEKWWQTGFVPMPSGKDTQGEAFP